MYAYANCDQILAGSVHLSFSLLAANKKSGKLDMKQVPPFWFLYSELRLQTLV